MPDYKLPPATTVGAVTLAVADLEMVTVFYKTIIGLQVIEKTRDTVNLGIDGQPLVQLVHQSGGKRHPRATGLFHLALLVPSRSDLGHWLQHLVDAGYLLDGAGDHLVSEALYLHDPEGNGIEIYRDRPRNEWQYDGNQVRMDTLPVDLPSLLAEAPSTRFTRLPKKTTMGHVHLQVDDVKKALVFYQGVLGFDLTASLQGAGFLSAGGYHHHIGVNSWHSRGASPPPEGSLGLRGYSVLLPTAGEKQALIKHLESRRIPVTQTPAKASFIDPFQNEISIVAP